MPKYWDSDGNEIGFREGLKFQAKDPKGVAEAQAARRLARRQGMTAHRRCVTRVGQSR